MSEHMEFFNSSGYLNGICSSLVSFRKFDVLWCPAIAVFIKSWHNDLMALVQTPIIRSQLL